MSASAPLLGLFRFTSAMMDTPGARKAGRGSSAGAASAARERSSANGVARLRCSRSSRTPARIPSRTVITLSLPNRLTLRMSHGLPDAVHHPRPSRPQNAGSWDRSWREYRPGLGARESDFSRTRDSAVPSGDAQALAVGREPPPDRPSSRSSTPASHWRPSACSPTPTSRSPRSPAASASPAPRTSACFGETALAVAKGRPTGGPRIRSLPVRRGGRCS